MRNPTANMLFLLLSTFLVGFAIGDNSTVDDVSVFTSAGIHQASETLGQNVAWGEWTQWSKWSPCTRNCGGGISRQQRRCRRKPCKGKSWTIKYKICNVQECEEPEDYRGEQCSSFDNVPYSGQLLKWYPHHDPTRPCSLICRGVQTANDRTNNRYRRAGKVQHGGVDNRGLIAESEDENIEEDEENNLATELDTDDAIVVQLADKVEDGTRCHPETTDVCISGSCMKVGCDMRVGSNKNKDICGVCGGNGSSCQPRYSWSLESISACSKSCGSGFKMAMPVCKSPDESVTEDSNCDESERPNKTLLPCNTHPCSTKWITGEWSRCSSSCGGGSRTRAIFCTEENGNETTRLPDHRCNAIHKPRYQETCNTALCPAWESSQWSQCSVTCGSGTRTRSIECRDADGRVSSDCETSERPHDEQECNTNVPCATYSGEMTQPLMQPYPPPPIPEKLIDQKVPTESTFIADEWSSCSVTCGEGIRHREVHCKIFLEFSRTIAKLPDKQCAGPKPAETEKCTRKACAPLDNSLSYRIDTVGDSGYEETNLMDSYRSSSGSGISSYESSVKVAPGSSIQTTYSWKESGYTPCTATCLGGVQDLIINCVRDDDGKVVMPLLCTKETKPESRIRTCNDHPCPPRWNYSDFSPCRSPCGIGIQTRDVTCIHEVARGPGNTVVVPNQMCKPPPPADRQHCNVWDCPVKWQPGQWSKCSKSCGGGVKRRKVSCEQIMAQGHKQYRSDRDCPGSKPPLEKPCNTRSCHEMNSGVQPSILSANTSFIQRDIDQKVDLKIGGSATVFPGTAVVKIRCPVKKFKKNQIEWTKNGEDLQKSRKYKISRKGALRILEITYADDGIYGCVAGQSHSEIRLIVNARPREQMSSEEILRSGNTVHHHQNINLDSASSNSGENLQIDRTASGYQGTFTFGNDDLSHEARPEIPSSGKPTKKPRNRKKPKPSSITPDSSMAHGEYTVTSLNQAYWPFRSDSNLDRGHRMAPPMLLDDSRKKSPKMRPSGEYGDNDLRDDDRENDFKIFGTDTIIPDDTFGPDEERIFIDDDPYDLDAAFFAIHNEDAPKVDEETANILSHHKPRKYHENRGATGTERSIDYIEESLINTKRRDKGIVDNFLRNQRGTGLSDYEEENAQTNKNREEINSGEIQDKSAEKIVEKKSGHVEESAKHRTSISPRSLSDESIGESKDRYFADTSTAVIESSRIIVDHTSTTNAPEIMSKKEGYFRSELTLDSLEDDESYDGELSREKITTTRNKNQTDSLVLSEDGKMLGTRGSEGWDAFGNETTKEDTSGGAEVTKEEDVVEDVEIPKHSVVESRNSTENNKDSKESIGTAASLAFEENSSNETTVAGSINVFSRVTSDDFIFEWITTDWSKCSQTCGGGGFQMRGAQCTVRPTKNASNSTRIISRTVMGAALCENAGFVTPQKVRPCGAGRCPQWHTSEWTPCESSRCFDWKTAMQRRDISCRLAGDIDDGTQNVTLLDPNICDDGIRPPQRQECYNDACKGVWRVGDWSGCTPSCGPDGVKYRILQCVWYGTKKPAGNACRDIPRPPVMKTCRNQPCPQRTSEECKDDSRLCNQVKMMNLCGVPSYQDQCCETCREA